MPTPETKKETLSSRMIGHANMLTEVMSDQDLTEQEGVYYIIPEIVEMLRNDFIELGKLHASLEERGR